MCVIAGRWVLALSHQGLTWELGGGPITVPLFPSPATRHWGGNHGGRVESGEGLRSRTLAEVHAGSILYKFFVDTQRNGHLGQEKMQRGERGK